MKVLLRDIALTLVATIIITATTVVILEYIDPPIGKEWK